MSKAEQLPLQFEFRANQTFQDFFPGANQELVGHLHRCVAGTGEVFIFFWGKSGLGKSHLLQACCHEAHSLGINSFYFDLTHSSSIDPDILNGLDMYELVCFDNMERMAGNTKWEIAFFNFFNQQRDQGHRLIVSSELPAKTLAIKLPDLITRLNWGLSLKIQPLDENERITALRLKARQMGLEVSQQVGRYLLTHSCRDLASLWHLLSELDQASLAAQRKLTIPFLKQVLRKHHA